MRMFERIVVTCDISSWQSFLGMARGFSLGKFESSKEQYGRKHTKSRYGRSVSESWGDGFTRSRLNESR